MSTIIDRQKTLKQPLTVAGLSKPKRSRAFWRQLALSPIVLTATLILGLLWDYFDLPNFGPEGREQPWIFPLIILGAFFSVQNVFAAFREESERRSERWNRERIGAFQAEVFPFLESALKSVDRPGDYYGELDLPPLDWTVDRMLEDSEEGAAWGARYRDGEGTSHFKFTLENDGREVRFRAEIPGEVEIKNGV